MPAGIYNVTLRKNGYADQMTTVAVSDGEMSELNIQLAKN
jgi:PEGA domain.